MKKVLLFLCAAALLALPYRVFAADEELPDPGLTPESPFYFLDQFSEYVQLLFTSDPDTKIDMELTFAEERLAEIASLADTADETVLTKLQEAYDTNIENAIKLANDGENTENKLQIIEQAREMHAVKLQKAIENAPEDAKQVLQQTMEKTQTSMDDVQTQIEEESQNGNENGDTDRTTLRDRIEDVVNSIKKSDDSSSDDSNQQQGSDNSENGNENSGQNGK